MRMEAGREPRVAAADGGRLIGICIHMAFGCRIKLGIAVCSAVTVSLFRS
jgi:hypothetical protein